MVEPMRIVFWLLFLLKTFTFLGALVASLVLVRRASATGAYLVAAAAGLQLLMTCCARVSAMTTLQAGGDPGSLGIAMSCLDLLAQVGTLALVAYAFVTLSRAVQASASSRNAS